MMEGELFKRPNSISRRSIGAKMNKAAITPVFMDAIQDHHIESRAFQLSEMNDPRYYGITSPYFVFNHDQVPIELAAAKEFTINAKGVSIIIDTI